MQLLSNRMHFFKGELICMLCKTYAFLLEIEPFIQITVCISN